MQLSKIKLCIYVCLLSFPYFLKAMDHEIQKLWDKLELYQVPNEQTKNEKELIKKMKNSEESESMAMFTPPEYYIAGWEFNQILKSSKVREDNKKASKLLQRLVRINYKIISKIKLSESMVNSIKEINKIITENIFKCMQEDDHGLAIYKALPGLIQGNTNLIQALQEGNPPLQWNGTHYLDKLIKYSNMLTEIQEPSKKETNT